MTRQRLLPSAIGMVIVVWLGALMQAAAVAAIADNTDSRTTVGPPDSTGVASGGPYTGISSTITGT